MRAFRAKSSLVDAAEVGGVDLVYWETKRSVEAQPLANRPINDQNIARCPGAGLVERGACSAKSGAARCADAHPPAVSVRAVFDGRAPLPSLFRIG